MSKEIKRAFNQMCKSLNSNVFTTSITDIELVRNALTPPTQEEVCRELSEWFKDKVEYSQKDNRFFVEETAYDIVDVLEMSSSIREQPKLYIKLSQFYEGTETK